MTTTITIRINKHGDASTTADNGRSVWHDDIISPRENNEENALKLAVVTAKTYANTSEVQKIANFNSANGASMYVFECNT